MRERGSVYIEWIFVMPLFMTLFALIFWTASLMTVHEATDNAARSAARMYAYSVRYSVEKAEQAGKSAAENVLSFYIRNFKPEFLTVDFKRQGDYVYATVVYQEPGKQKIQSNGRALVEVPK